jgi:hypothetical protein
MNLSNKVIRISVELMEGQDSPKAGKIRVIATAIAIVALKGLEKNEIEDAIQRLASNGLNIILAD